MTELDAELKDVLHYIKDENIQGEDLREDDNIDHEEENLIRQLIGFYITVDDRDGELKLTEIGRERLRDYDEKIDH